MALVSLRADGQRSAQEAHARLLSASNPFQHTHTLRGERASERPAGEPPRWPHLRHHARGAPVARLGAPIAILN